VEVVDRRTIRLQIWERGAGYTLASGSSSCAAAAVAHRLGLVDAAVSVRMPGGQLAVEIGDAWQVRQTGPVALVFRGEWSGG
jgi:diaminopimelate epimerase